MATTVWLQTCSLFNTLGTKDFTLTTEETKKAHFLHRGCTVTLGGEEGECVPDDDGNATYLSASRPKKPRTVWWNQQFKHVFVQQIIARKHLADLPKFPWKKELVKVQKKTQHRCFWNCFFPSGLGDVVLLVILSSDFFVAKRPLSGMWWSWEFDSSFMRIMAVHNSRLSQKSCVHDPLVSNKVLQLDFLAETEDILPSERSYITVFT